MQVGEVPAFVPWAVYAVAFVACALSILNKRNGIITPLMLGIVAIGLALCSLWLWQFV